ncbi:MAG: ribosome rescue protein RqcH [Nitrososphaeria archaeon]
MSTQALSNIELFHQARWLNASLKDYYVNNVYWITGNTLLIRLHHPSKPEKRLVIDSGKSIWVTESKLEDETDTTPSQFRKRLLRGKIKSIEQVGTERILFISLVGSEAKKLVTEFFGNGNIILLDEQDVILEALEYYDTRHRSIRKMSKYTLPPERGLDPLKIDEESIKPILEYDEDFRKWIGNKLALPKKFIDIIPKQLKVPPGTTGRQLKPNILPELVEIIHKFFDEKELTPTLIVQGDNIVGFTIYKVENGQYATREVKDINQAIDVIYTKAILEQKNRTLLQPLHKAEERLKSTIGQLLDEKERLNVECRMLTDIATSLRENIVLYYQSQSLFEEKLKPAKLIIEDDTKKLILKNYKFDFEDSNPLKTASEIFGTAKELLQKIDKIDESINNLKEELDRLEEKIKLKEETISKKHKKAFEKEWFERYRWFYTSDGFLSIGGRDASSNEAIVKKHLEENDIIFHAEFTGAPFFIVKDGRKATEASIKETATAAVAFSNLWKFGTALGEAYWFYKDQISKKAPSGQYIARGAFMITGKRNYIKNLPLELAVGIVKVKDHYTVICGPKEAIKKSTDHIVLIVPGREDKNSVAKKIKAVLSEKMASLEGVKDIPLEDYIRALPPGGCKIKLQ